MSYIVDMPPSEYDAIVEISEPCELGVRVESAVVRLSIVSIVGPQRWSDHRLGVPLFVGTPNGLRIRWPWAHGMRNEMAERRERRSKLLLFALYFIMIKWLFLPHSVPKGCTQLSSKPRQKGGSAAKDARTIHYC